ncbi:MAG: L-seryl-tRNA(Sec) selenium transferase [Verrucomicrobia bacterium]|nr:L-seryl-tRNA(Sec) selenium transferase [Verrucomicrobiota bacterium]
MNSRPLRDLPSVDKLKSQLGSQDLPAAVVTRFIRGILAESRRQKVIPDAASILNQVREALRQHRARRLRPVINGTGILIHTNLGRAPLAESAAERVATVARHYNTLELDLETGGRGNRASYLETHLALACDAEAATAVNNGAAALVLAVRPWIQGERREVLVSRGEAIQIGGGFRIPEILESAGATLRDVGTTNRTTAGDFSRAISSRTALILKVHRSNFFMEGFVESPTLTELSALAKKRKVPLVEDLGSGAMMRTEHHGLGEHEPRPSESIAAGVDVVCFSGDKLFGGPQAGLLAGKRRAIAAMKKDPLYRAFRCDKLVLAALQETLDLHLYAREKSSQPAPPILPLIEMLDVSLEDLRARGERLLAGLPHHDNEASISECSGQVGGGSMPRSRITSLALKLRPSAFSAQTLSQRLRHSDPPVIGFLAGNALWLDLRTIFPAQDEQLLTILKSVLTTA